VTSTAHWVQASAADLTEKLSDAKSCKAASHLVTTGMNVSSEVATVTATLETALKAKASCACETVTAVIEATGADAKDKKALIEAIVETAITAIPEQTATITECAVAAAPAHASAIEKVLNKVFASQDKDYLGEGSSKNGYSKQESYGKGEPVDTVEVADEPEYPAYALPAPVYLIAPSGGIVPPGDFSPTSPSEARYDGDES
jgi:DNA-binding phage protein